MPGKFRRKHVFVSQSFVSQTGDSNGLDCNLKSSELHKEDVQVSQKDVFFTIMGLTKSRKVNDKPLVFTFIECENEKPNVRKCLLDYQERTRLLRENETRF